MKKLLIVSISFIIGIFSVAYAQQVSNNIRALLSSEGRVLYGEEPNSIVVTDYPDNIQRIADYLDVVDVSPKQVLIEAKVVEVRLDKENNLGINWQAFAHRQGFRLSDDLRISSSKDGIGPLEQQIPYKGSDDPFTVTIFNDNLNVVLEALAATLDTSILSAPSVTTVNNREAQIKIIQNLPWAEPEVEMSDYGLAVTWKVHFESVGIMLKATPTINDDGKITLSLLPEVSEKVDDYPLSVVQSGYAYNYTVPIIDKRTASTKVVIGNGQTLIIGGLMKDKTIKDVTKVPVLGDMPILGNLFRSKQDTVEKTELLIFVSPTIITQEQISRMAKIEKYGLGRDYTKERERHEKMMLILEREQEGKKVGLAAQMEALVERQKSLAEESKRLQEQISREEKDVKDLEETKNSVLQKRKELQKK